MKAKSIPILIAVVFVLAAFAAWTVSAQGPRPPESGLLPPQTLPPAESLPLEPEFKRLTSHVRPENQTASIPLGQPGLSFRYVQTFGITGKAYISDTQHLNFPLGLFVDSANNLYVTEAHGARVLKFRTSDRAVLLVIGEAGLRLGSPGTLVEPRDVAVDSAGNIWIADGNVVYQYDSTGRYIRQIGDARGSDNMHFAYVNGVAFDSAGRLYVSDTDNHRIQIYTFSGGQPVYYATIGVTGQQGSDNNHFRWPAKIAIDGNNRLYVADSGNFRVQRCVHAGGTTWTCSTFHGTGTEGSGPGQLGWAWGLGADRNNNVYIADSSNNRVKKCDSNGNCSIFATGLNFPTDVVVDSLGNVYIANAFSFTVLKYGSAGAHQDIFAGVNGVPYVTDDRHFNAPAGVAVDAGGNIYITEEWGYRLLKLNPTGTVLWRVGTPGVWGRDNARFGSWRQGPADVAVGPTGRVYVADPANYRVQVYDSNGNYIATLGGTYGTSNYEFRWPWGLAVDSAGNLYVVDVYNHRVQIYDSNLVYRRTLGVTGVAGSDNAHFNYPYGVAVDRNGNIYVADNFNYRVQVFNKDGVHIRTLGVTGEPGYDFGHFLVPVDVAVDFNGRIYVMDWYRVQVFDQNGAYLTTIGGDRGTASGQFNGAYAIAVDNAGNVYVADTYNHRIQKFAPGVPGWVQVNINGFGDRYNLNILSLASFGNRLYAGTYNDNGAQLWRMDASGTWSQVINNGFGNPRNVGINHLLEFNNQLYAGTWADEVNGGEIWRSSNGINWTRVVSQGFGDPTNAEVFRLGTFKGQIYASTCSYTTTHGAEIWRSATGNSNSWSRVVSNGFGDPNNALVPAFEVFNDYLYASTFNDQTGGEIWRSSTGTDGSWVQVNADGFGDAGNIAVSALAVFQDHLYASTIHRRGAGAQIWRCQVCDGSDWQKVVDNGFGNPDTRGMSGLEVFDGHLYFIVGNYATGIEVWRTADGTRWEQVGSAGLGDSNNLAPYWDNSITVFNNRLFIGTWNYANGGEVWMLLHRRVYLPLVLRNR